MDVEEDNFQKIRRNAIIISLLAVLVLMGKIAPGGKTSIAGFDILLSNAEFTIGVMVIWIYQIIRFYGAYSEWNHRNPYDEMYKSENKKVICDDLVESIKNGSGPLKESIYKVEIIEIIENAMRVQVRFHPVCKNADGKIEYKGEQTNQIDKNHFEKMVSKSKRIIKKHSNYYSEISLPWVILSFPAIYIVHVLVRLMCGMK